MQRLREQTSSPDAATARAAALLASMPPLDGDRLRPGPLPFREPARRGAPGRIRTALVLAITLGSVAAAAATLRGSRWLDGSRRANTLRTATPPVPTAPTMPVSPHGAQGSAVVESPTETPAVEPLSAGPLSADRTTRPHLGPTLPGSRATAARASRAKGEPRAAGAAESSEDESTLIVAAVRALRRDGNPSRAEVLAEEALERYPQGAQVEEAMALAMEATAAGRDPHAARAAAQRYLEAFPAGRFADRATRLLASPPR